MTYRNDHDAALVRLEILEHEHRVLVEELAQTRALKARAARKAWLRKLVPHAYETKVALAVVFVIVVRVCAGYLFHV
jgi:hypothetical protein